MYKREVQLWAIMVKTTSLGDVLAEDMSSGYPPGQTWEFRYVLCDTKGWAERVMKLGEFVPKGTARVVPVVVEVREISPDEAEERAKDNQQMKE